MTPIQEFATAQKFLIFILISQSNINACVVRLFTKTLRGSTQTRQSMWSTGDPRENRDMYFQRRRGQAHPRFKSFVCRRFLSSGLFTIESYYFIRLNLNTPNRPCPIGDVPVATGLIIEFEKFGRNLAMHGHIKLLSIRVI